MKSSCPYALSHTNSTMAGMKGRDTSILQLHVLLSFSFNVSSVVNFSKPVLPEA